MNESWAASAITRRRLAAALVLALFLLGQVLVQVHLAAVPHRTCAAHGELVHASAGVGEPTDAASGRDSESGDEPGDRTAGDERRDSGHTDHCGVAAAARQQADGAPLLSSFSAGATREWFAAATANVAPRADGQRYLLAPKQSPPAEPA
jgi:hypothetical protein